MLRNTLRGISRCVDVKFASNQKLYNVASMHREIDNQKIIQFIEE